MTTVPRLVILALILLGSHFVRADPSTLPRYHVELKFDTAGHRVDFQQTVTWTNRAKTPTSELVLNFYPHYSIPEGDFLLLAKTLELLRLNPRDGIDRHGRAGILRTVTLAGGGPLEFSYQHDNPTAFAVKLPKAVGPGETVSVILDATITLPNKQGRWGHWQGIHYLTNSLPVAAYYDDRGWHAMPFVPWHQPFWNEAGLYTAKITLPCAETLACSAAVKEEVDNGDGTKTVVTEPFLGRDFALLASSVYQETKSTVTLKSGKIVTLKCLAYAKHEFYAQTLLKFVAEALPVYSEWFGDYPYQQFTIAESFFGWNGNECAGLVLIDERVFASPHLASGYVEYLVSHETCHQWWYNLIGTNGYSETFMDEGAATYFTHRMLDRKHGDKNNPFMHWPKELKWLPNINRENYRYGSMYSALGKNQMQPAAGELPGFKHLVNLFNGAYDRGSKSLGMIEARLGEAAFMDFIRDVVTKYSFEVLQSADFKQELETYTGQDWTKFYEDWIYGKGTTDWKIESVDGATWRLPRIVRDPIGINRYYFPRSRIIIQQTGVFEPTTLAVSYSKNDQAPLRIPISGEAIQDADPAGVCCEPLGNGRFLITLPPRGMPMNVVVDPDHVLLDSRPANNRWNNPPRVHFTPLYTMLNETDLTNDYERWNFGGGPWIGGALYQDPWYVRSTMVGIRDAAYRTQIFSGGLYGAYRTDYRDVVIGADGLFDHTPFPKTQIGYNIERRVAGPFGDVDGNQATRASVYGRYVLDYGLSLYLPPIQYVEAFSTYQDNFLPFTRTPTPGAVRPSSTFLNGIHYRLNLYTPYWDPECGLWTDLVYGGGIAQLPGQVGMHELRGELALVKKFPDWCLLGPLSDTRLAIRGVAMGALPNEGQFFALGGGTLFRGYDLAQRQGSALWVGNVELRLPLARDVQWDVLDHVFGARNLWLATFYDVGAIYADGRSVGGVAHALGVGLRVDTAIFSFIERATLRFDVGKTINDSTPFQFWFGVQHAF